ncbi:MAG: ATP-binding protein [Chthoniobacterales bacterium]|nr:ATP-binding protein [Chthoniobacterales bacterium]
MNKIAIKAQKDFLENLSHASPIRAISELIWNGLDAGANHVAVRLETDHLEGIEKIRVKDSGSGINHSEIQPFFGNLGDSWKKKKGRNNGRALHGKNGQGRFKAFSLGTRVEWNTIYDTKGTRMRYQIVGRADALTDLLFSDPVEANGDACGTEVIVSDTKDGLGALMTDNARNELAKLFAAYLSQYPDITIEYNGVRVDPLKLQRDRRDIFIEEIPLVGGETATATVTVVEWLMPAKRVVHLCDASGISLHETDAGQQIRAPGFDFTVYVKCDRFLELNNEGLLSLDELHPDVGYIVQSAKRAVKAHFRRKLFEQQSHIVERWKQEQIYPFEEKEHLNAVEEAERQVFDILAVNVESYLPSFEEADTKSKKFMFRLLAQALKDNPDSVQKIITEMLSLKKEEQETLAELLESTSLSNIISCSKTVANRLDFLVALDALIFGEDTKKKLLERDQLHKILESEAWIFDEEFALSGSEERLEDVLEKHAGFLGERVNGGTDVVVGEGKTGRIDLRLSRGNLLRSGELDYLIVELKRPSKKIDDSVISQVKKYAMAVAGDERFNGIPARWKFIAVSNEMDQYAKNDANQPDRPSGQVWISPDRKITVWVREWAEVINTARARLNFINKTLSYEASRESSRAYLVKTHAKFIPETELSEEQEGMDSTEQRQPQEEQ